MALTKDILKANQALQSLTDEQIVAITTLSQNDENSVIGAKTGALHGQYDQDVLMASGIEKDKGEKSYDYAKRVISSLKNLADTRSELENQINTLKAEKQDLQNKINSGSKDTTLATQLTDAQTKISDLQKALDTEKQKVTDKALEFTNDLKQVHVDYAFGLAVSDLKFKASIPESVKSVLIEDAKAKILKENIADIAENNGVKSVVFRDTEGKILNNPENNLNPFTVKDMVTSKLKDVIDFGRKKVGTQTQPGDQDDTGGKFSMDGIKTQTEASSAIRRHLLSEGVAVTSPEFSEKQTQIWTENNVDKLPIR